MAIVILGGLVTTTLLDLFVLPALYMLHGAKREPALELAISGAGPDIPVGGKVVGE